MATDHASDGPTPKSDTAAPDRVDPAAPDTAVIAGRWADQPPVPGPGDRLVDADLVDHRGRTTSVAGLVRIPEASRRQGFGPGPVLVLTGRGWFCPRDQAHLPAVVATQDDLGLNGVTMAYIATQHWREQAAFRAGLDATFPFLSDQDRALLGPNGLVDWTEGEEADVARPYAFLATVVPADGADPGLVITHAWDGWWLAGRPDAHDLRAAVREVAADNPGGAWEDWTTPDVLALRVPQRTWAEDRDPPGRVERRDLAGTVAAFDRAAGSGWIEPDDADDPDLDRVWFHFTAVPGSGYRIPAVGTPVTFDLLTHPAGPAATNVRPRG